MHTVQYAMPTITECLRQMHTRGTGNTWLILHIHQPAATGKKLKSNAYLRG